MGFLTEDELNQLIPAEMLPHTTPIPTQIISSDEYMPPPQSEKQKEVEARLLDMSDDLGKKQGLSARFESESCARLDGRMMTCVIVCWRKPRTMNLTGSFSTSLRTALSLPTYTSGSAIFRCQRCATS
jgi:hypothetical protein